MKRRILGIAYALQRFVWRTFKPRTRGVKVMLFTPAGQLLLIRNSYGRSDLMVLPGGGARLFERPEDTARREIKEELGLTVGALDLRSRHISSSEGKRDQIYLFEARVDGNPEIDGIEVLQVCFASPDSLPTSASPATRRRVDEYLGRRTPDGSW